MPSLEPIVRPFVGTQTTPQPGVATVAAIVPNVVVIAGASGSGKIMHGSYNSSLTVYNKKRPKEIKN